MEKSRLLKSFKILSPIRTTSNGKVVTLECPYCFEPIQNRSFKLHLTRMHNKTVSESIRYLNELEDEQCVMCEKRRVIDYRDPLKPYLRPTCKDHAQSYGRKLQMNYLKNTVDETTGKSLIKLRMEKQFSTMKSRVDENGISDFEKWLDQVEKSTRSKAKRFKSTELYYRSLNEFEFFSDNYEKMKLTKAPTIKDYYKNRWYIPDAYVKSTNTIVEIKSKGVMMVRQSPLEVYLKFKKVIELGYNILFVLDYKEYTFKNTKELDKFFDKFNLEA